MYVSGSSARPGLGSLRGYCQSFDFDALMDVAYTLCIASTTLCQCAQVLYYHFLWLDSAPWHAEPVFMNTQQCQFQCRRLADWYSACAH